VVNDTSYSSGYVGITPRFARIKVRTLTTLTSATAPGDTVVYTIYYDNDGTDTTGDTGFVVAYLPEGTAFLDTLENKPDTARNAWAAGFDIDWRHNGAWLENLPAGADSLYRIEAVRYTIPPGVGDQASGVNPDQPGPMADDSLDSDAGYVKFRVRIR
jgi:hypothetical protein